ncbi:MAG: hypothetical protein ACK42H_16285 [Planctomycetota bacterium]|jgi:hypothetical protein
MAHFAQLDENNVVTQVIVVHNSELVESKQTTVNEDGSVSVAVIESEQKGIDFCKSLYGADTNWAQTSYNNSFRGKYAGVGDTFDAQNNLFVAPPPPVVEVIEVPQQTESVVALGSTSIATLTSDDIQALSSADVQTLSSTDVQALSSADIPALTTSDISSLG